MLTTILGQREPTYFRSLRDRLCRQLGVIFPNFCFVVDNGLKKNTFGLTANHLVGVPRSIGAFDKFLYEWMRTNSARFINVATIEHLLSATSDLLPSLVNNVCRVYTTQEITGTIRILTKENISIRPIRSLLEGLLNARFVVADTSLVTFCNLLVLSSAPAEDWMHKPEVLAACLRVNMNGYITTQYAGLDRNIIVMSLDPDLERELTRLFWSAHGDPPGTKNWTRQQVILDAIHRAVKAGDYQTSTANIITSSEARMSLQQLVRCELPELPVLAYQELLPDTVVHHQGCISAPM